MRRRAWSLNHKTETPCCVISVDVETLPVAAGPGVPEGTQLFRYAAIVKRTYRKGEVTSDTLHDCHRVKDFWSILCDLLEQREVNWIVAHNWAFDFTALRGWAALESGFLESKSMALTPACFVIDGTMHGARVKFVDLGNWCPMPLEKIGRCIGNPKLDCDPLRDDFHKVVDYCKRDATIVADAMTRAIRFIRTHDLGNMRSTPSSQSWQAFRHHWMRTRIQPTDLLQPLRMERRSYYGGRVLVRKVGEVDTSVFHLDVNGLYPSVMLNGTFPTELAWQHNNVSLAELSSIAKRGPCVAAVHLRGVKTELPCRIESETWYCNGDFATVLAGEELQHAIDAGVVSSCDMLLEYHADKWMNRMVEEVWLWRLDYKRHGCDLESYWCKVLLDALHGKIAQMTPDWKDRPKAEVPDAWTTWQAYDSEAGCEVPHRSIGWHAQAQVGRIESAHSFPAVSACVTAAARMRMRHAFDVIDAGHVYYSDTDSIHTSATGLRQLSNAGLINHSKLGSFRLVEAATHAEYRGAKNYTFGGRDVVAGTPKKVLARDGYAITVNEFQTVQTIIKCRPGKGPIVRPKTMRIDRTVIRGDVMPNGSVSPAKLPQLGLSAEPFCTEPLASSLD